MGIVVFAVGLEDVVSHHSDQPDVITRLAIACGTALVLVTVAAATFRAIRRLMFERLIAAVVLLIAIWAGSSLSSVAFATLTVVVTITALASEHRRPWPEVGEGD